MKLQQINLDSILEPAEQVRKVISADQLEDLVESIKKIGLIEPLVVKPVGEKYEVIAGHRRLLACRTANATPVPCMVRVEGESNEDEIKLHENFFREDINPADEAEFYAYMIERRRITIEDIAEKVHKSGTYIRERLNLLRGDKVILEAVRDKVISAGAAKELNMIAVEETRNYYLKYAIDSGATVRTVQEWRKQWERECRTQEVLDAGHTPEELPNLLPKYYCKCPMCEKPTDLGKMRAVSVCENCYGSVMASFAAAPEEKTEE